MESEADRLQAISEKLEVINLQLAQRKTTKRAIIRWLLISICAMILVMFAALIIVNSPYLGWITVTLKPPSWEWHFTPLNGCLSEWRLLS